MGKYCQLFCVNNNLIILLVVNLLTGNTRSVVVKTKQGQVRGERLKVLTGNAEYYSFKGIPFAKPPVGDLRFRAPQPPDHWSGVRNATEHGPLCIQISVYQANFTTGSEDCLYLNVYTPDINPKSNLSVMIYIHGGGFETGTCTVDRFGPDYLITENVVLVTINYRLGSLGFLSLNNKEVPGNAGLKDQVAAMKWVQSNIANFGGDPRNVTIFGQSAGAVSVALHNLSPMTKGLYGRSVAMSGSPFNNWATPFEPRRRAFRLGQQLGLWTRDDQKLLTFLKSLPPEQLLGPNADVLRSETPRGVPKHFVFIPVVETDYGGEHFLTMDPLQALKSGIINNVDLMMGHTSLEGLINFVAIDDKVKELYTNYTELIVPRHVLDRIPPAKLFDLGDVIHAKYFGYKPINNEVARELVRYMSEIYFNYGIDKYATMFSKYRKTYMYKFSRLTQFTRYINLDNKFGINGATHEDDLMYLFYPHNGNITVNKNSADFKVVQSTCALYTNFAKYGNPTPDNSLDVEWPPYNTVNEYYLDIDTKLTVGEHLDADMVAFWDSIYEAAGLRF